MTRKFSFICFIAALSLITALPAQTNGPSLFFVPGIVSSLQVGVPVSTQINVSGGRGPYSITATSFSGYGLRISSTGLLTGTPTTATTSTALVAVNVLDTGTRGAVTQTLSLGLSISPAPLVITTASLPYAIVGGGFSTSVAMIASGGTPPYTFSTSAGSLNGLSLNSDGTFTGAFTSSGNPARVSIQVTDSSQTSYVKAYAFRVYDALSISAVPTLLNGIVGKDYGIAQFSAAGGSGSYVWSGGGFPVGLSIGATTGAITGTPTTAGFSVFNVTLTDNVTGRTSSASELGIAIYPALAITGPATLAPGVANVAYPSTTVTAIGTTSGSIFSATGLPSGLSLSSAGVLTGTPTTAGSNTVLVTVTEPTSGQIVRRTYPLNVYAPLSITSPTSFGPGVFGTAFAAVTSTATGGGGGNTWTAAGLPAGILMDSKGVITGTPTASGISQVAITVADAVSGQRASTAALSLTVYSTLTISSPSTLPFGVVSSAYSTASAVATGGSGNVTWSAAGLPSALTIAGNSGSISGTPTTAGTSQLVVTATDSATGQTATKNYSVVIYDILKITALTGLSVGVSGKSYGPTSAAATGGSGTNTWTASGLPAPLTINAGTGAISGTAGSVGTASVVLTVTDSVTGQSVSKANLSLQVYGVLSIASPASLPVGVLSLTYLSVTVAASGGSGGATFSATGLPAGLQIGSAGLISGTPTSKGAFAVVVTATDSETGQVTAKNYSIVIYDPMQITAPSSFALAVVGKAFGPTTAAATGGSGTVTWSSSGLPAVFSINASTGAISGTPTTAGLSSVVLTATDSVTGQTSSTSALSLVVYPVLTISEPANLPFGILTQAYSGASAVAAGGSGGATFAATGLPAGLTMNSAGAITGIPTALGAASVVVTATDAVSSQTATKNYTLTIYDVFKISAPTLFGAAVVGKAFGPTTAAATGGSGTVTWSSSGLPAVFSINASTGAISGTPTTAGRSSVVLTATDSVTGQTSSTSALLLVVYPVLIISGPANFSFGILTQAYSGASAVAAGGSGGATFAATGLPAGLTMNSAGAITGTPTALGAASVVVTVTDAVSSQIAIKNYTLTIYDVLKITAPTSFNFGVVGRLYGPTAAAATGGSGTNIWTATGLPVSLTMNSGTGAIGGTPTAAAPLSIAVTVTDSVTGQTATTASLPLTIYSALTLNVPSPLGPGVNGLPISTIALLANGGTGTYSFSQSGLPNGLAINSTTGAITGTPNVTNVGTFTVTLTVTDTNSAQTVTKSEVSMRIYSQISATGPAVLPAAVIARAYFGTTITGTGGSGNYQWGFPSEAPTYGLSLSQGGVLSGSATGNTGIFGLTVTMLDLNSGQQISKVFQLRLFTAPQITGPSALPYAVAGKSYAAVAITTSGGSGAFGWTATGLPGGFAIDPFVGTISSPSVTATTGTYPFSVTLSDGTLNIQVSQNFTLQTYDSLTIPAPSSLANGVYNIAYSDTTISAVGGIGRISWSAAGLPSGLQIGSSTGKISGTPSIGGNFSVVVTASDGGSGQTATRTYSLTVAYSPLSISAAKTNLGTVALGTNVSFPFGAVGGRGPYLWSLSGNAPTGVLITSGGLVTGSATTAGNSLFTVTLTDAQVPPEVATVTVSLGTLGLSNGSVLPNAAAFDGYSYTFLASGGVAPYTFSSAGILPAGLTLASNGLLSGSPTAAGAFNFPVTVSDGNGVKSSAFFSLTIAAPTPISIQSGSFLADANLGVPYSIVLSAIGGNPPYTWALNGGSLPDGLSLAPTGTISGTPVSPGTFNFSVKATDGSGGSATASFTAKVLPSALQITTSTLPLGVTGSDYPQQVFAATGGIGTYTFAVTAGSPPTGLTLTNEVLGGTATAGGDFNFTITVTDSANTTATRNFKITIRTTANDLLLSASALSFSSTAGSSLALDPQTVTVKASSQTSNLTYSVIAPASANWLQVSAGSGTAPSSIQFSITPPGLALTVSPSTASVVVNCLSGACAGTSQSVAVSLTVSTLPAKLSVLTDLLSYSSNSTNPQSSAQLLQLRNTGGGTIGISSIGANANWCTLGSSTGLIGAGGALPVTVFANPQGLAAGFYRTTVDIVTSAGSVSVPVTLLIAANSSVVLSPSGAQFVLAAGGVVGNRNGSFVLSVAGQTPIDWNSAALPGADWLQVNSASGQATSGTPSKILYSINASAAAVLKPQAYYGTIRVTSPDAVNSPFDFQVILNVVGANTPVNPDPQPAGLIFLTPAGVSPPPQIVTVYAGIDAVSGAIYQASSTMQTGSGWLKVSPATGTTSAALPALSNVTVNSTGLPPGVYSGGVSYTLSGAGVRTVNVTLVVQAQLSSADLGQADLSQAIQAEPSPKATCAPTALAPTQTGLVNNFSAPTSWPTPLAIRLYNDCGVGVPDGQLTVTFSNGDPPLAMPLVDRATALYSATWTPRATSSQVTVTAQARAAGFQDAKALITGSVTPNKAPVLAKNGTFHIFYPQVGAALAPGNVVQIYGSALASVTTAPTSIPLPTQLNGTSVIIGGIETPMFFASAGQVNVQIPFELAPGKQYQVVVNANGALTAPGTINIAGVAPGLAAFADGSIIAQHGDGSLVLPTAPAAPGEFIVLYASGMGRTDNAAQTGGASPTDPLARPINAVSLTLDGANVPVAFAGLTPGLVGLYQINFQVPTTAKDGNLALVVSQDGNASNPTTLWVKKLP